MNMTDPDRSQSKVPTWGGTGQKQVDQPGGPGTPDAEQGQSWMQEVGDDLGVGSTRPPGIGNAGGSTGNGAKGSGTLIAHGKVVGSGSHSGTNSAGPEGKTAVDGTSPEIRSTKAPNVTHGNKDIGVAGGMLFPGIVE